MLVSGQHLFTIESLQFYVIIYLLKKRKSENTELTDHIVLLQPTTLAGVQVCCSLRKKLDFRYNGRQIVICLLLVHNNK